MSVDAFYGKAGTPLPERPVQSDSLPAVDEECDLKHALLVQRVRRRLHVKALPVIPFALRHAARNALRADD